MEVRSVLQIKALICSYVIDNRVDPEESSIVNIGAAYRSAIRSAQSRAESSEERGDQTYARVDSSGRTLYQKLSIAW